MNSCAIPAELSRFPRIFVTTSYLNREWLVAHHDWRKKNNETSRIPPNKEKSIRGDSGDSWPVLNRGITLNKCTERDYWSCFCPFLGTDVSPFPNFNNSVSTTRRYSLLHCWTHQNVTLIPNFPPYVLQSIRFYGWFRGRVVNSPFWPVTFWEAGWYGSTLYSKQGIT